MRWPPVLHPGNFLLVKNGTSSRFAKGAKSADALDELRDAALLVVGAGVGDEEVVGMAEISGN